MAGELLDRKAIPPFAALRAFEAVGRLGGVRKAASSLGLDHAVVSRHVRQLEEWLGTPLFRRDAGRLELSDVGTRYYARVSAGLVELASATLEVAQAQNLHQISLWCIPGFGAQWIGEHLADFEQLHPEITVEMRPTEGIADLVMHEADIDVRFYGDWEPPAGGKGLQHVELARPEVFPVASPDVAARYATVGSARNLTDAPLLHEEHHEQWRCWFARNGVEVVGDLPGPRLWHAHLAIAAAKRSRGIALANDYLVKRDLASGDLVKLMPPDARAVPLGAYAFVTCESRWRIPSIAQLRRHLQNRAGTVSSRHRLAMR